MALGTKSKEEPMKDAQLSKFEVEKGDIVIMGSDGLSDNLVSSLAYRQRRKTNRF
jgi:protein phosphatase PTC7